MTQKTTPATALATFNLHIIHLTLPYIFHTHSPQNTHTYLSCTFKFHVSQSTYIYIYKRSMSNKVSTYNSHTYYKHHISQYIYFLSSLHVLKYIKHSSKNLLLKALSYERQKLIKSKVLLIDRKSTRLNSSHYGLSRMPSSA